MAGSNGYTPTQRRILELLSDGLPHHRREVHACLGDELTPMDTVSVHISYLRKKLRPKGEDIVCEFLGNWQFCYRHVRLLGSPYSG